MIFFVKSSSQKSRSMRDEPFIRIRWNRAHTRLPGMAIHRFSLASEAKLLNLGLDTTHEDHVEHLDDSVCISVQRLVRFDLRNGTDTYNVTIPRLMKYIMSLSRSVSVLSTSRVSMQNIIG